MRRAIFEYVIIGVKTTLPMHNAIMNDEYFITGNTNTHFLKEEHVRRNLGRYLREEEARMETLASSLRNPKEKVAIAAALSVYGAMKK